MQSPGRRSAPLVRFIGLAELGAAAGLLKGLFWQPVGIAAAVGFGLLLIGAVRFHAKAGDYANPRPGATRWHPPLTAVAVAAALTLALSAWRRSAAAGTSPPGFSCRAVPPTALPCPAAGVKATARPAAGILPVRGGGGRRVTAAVPALRIR
ncbi:DoxX family protein [Streptomyces mirabilis]|uniref:DoxX family protein n=1 Tax=Streptomyces mirabilis TaxID=68239 RepID=UPI003697C4E3